MKKISVCLFALALTACNATPQDQDFDMRMAQSNLPEGCNLHYAGDVRVANHSEDHPSRIFFVNCKDTVTTSETHSVQQGKTTVDQNNVTVIRK
jgi:hypothetical protein